MNDAVFGSDDNRGDNPSKNLPGFEVGHGRKSPFILPFLLKRRENGGYVYYRCLPADVRSAISGEVLCPWNGETRVLSANAAIKFSINTTDFATARQRWNEVHAHVELVVGAATRRQRADRLNRSRRSVDRHVILAMTQFWCRICSLRGSISHLLSVSV